MPSTEALLRAYGQTLIPDRIDEMDYREAAKRGALHLYKIRQDLSRLFERDCETIQKERGS